MLVDSGELFIDYQSGAAVESGVFSQVSQPKHAKEVSKVIGLDCETLSTGSYFFELA